jgi:hypothetical protein
MEFKNKEAIDQALSALGEQLAARSKARIDLLVCGGSALHALKLVTRSTKDVDVVAIIAQDPNHGLVMLTAKPLPPPLIEFKLYAAVDQGGKHYDDLRELAPTADELEQAARWSMTHDVSDGYRGELKRILQEMGHDDVAQRI